MLHHLSINKYVTYSGKTLDINLSYEIFGQPLHSAPIIMVNHALTGNSDVAGEHGWWTTLIGEGKCIDTKKYTILCFNIPGNGYDGFVIDNYKDFVAKDIAKIFLLGLEALKISKLYALIGGSLGGGIAWEMAALDPHLTEHLIPVASDWKSTDWLIANCQIQEQFLINSKQPVHDARMHAMLCYRTPESFKERFKRSTNEELKVFNVESWLTHHGKKLQERFQLSAYKLMNQLLKTIDINRNGEEAFINLQNSDTNIHIVGVDSDLFFTAQENKDTFKKLAQANSNVTYGEIHSLHGHDAFLIEFNQMEELLKGVFERNGRSKKVKVLKFGGKSLANGVGLDTVLQIITTKVKDGENIAVVVSARNKATDQLEAMLDKAAKGLDYVTDFEEFEKYQKHTYGNVNLSEEFRGLVKLFEGVALLGDYSPKIKDQVLAYGELLSAKLVAKLLIGKGVNAKFIDSRQLIKTDSNFGDAKVLEALSKENVKSEFGKLDLDAVVVTTGFIASNELNETTTLGRNGSNYSAALLANYLNAEELQNYTHVDGIFTANPDLVTEAKRISELSYSEANELANFGTNILHAKTIIPLIEKNIPLRILNTFNNDNEGTLISAKTSKEGIKSLSVIENMALINLEGRGLLGKVGVDARIFRTMGNNNISVSIISQGSSERGIGLVVDAKNANLAKTSLEEEFQTDFKLQDINNITVIDQVSVISIVGQDLSTFHKPFNALIKNQVVPLLFNNTVSGKNVSLVVKKSDLHKALNVVHGQIFGISKKVNLAIFGHGNVGGTLIDQILKSNKTIEKRKGININVFAVANSKKVLLSKNGISKNWKSAMETKAIPYKLNDIFKYAKDNHLENLIAVDNTANEDFVASYFDFVDNGFDLVSSNKIANTLGFDYYQLLREELAKHQKQYLYETNVGAGLPLIDTIKLLHLSGENITRIKGVFSGSLSYIFNTFSEKDASFREILKEAMDLGYTEPDPREDLSGNDVGRKLLILARELDLSNEFSDIQIENLIPESLQDVDVKSFLEQLDVLDEKFSKIKKAQKPGYVLRYVGDLSGDLNKEKGKLEVKLISVPKESALGQIKGSDSIIEIYTESYGQHPLVIQGAGAGAAVTARGVFGDILRIAEKG
ncbi:bifunctional aspartate kinase/homoserine dehydrogenase I [Arenibacter sp. M-2]|uniref:bifunctional aspartate kinase/homoserine dehydrogenase I n=1 Tax=unclassified Arenibacter TaxID=2615047 RepID=UPI000D765ED7|nr:MULTISPECIES: bifunctional aspartate kinase/homoserine dehydrogenase I [unclassified Arenibacter]MDL5513631.1 bifunctional aspartate kinase/homoserine dehydrogenase I [Arenibacter sp. M-2]PXX25268.1 aspartate kinase [Arenibacter sp. ARW7G5Y1]|tara:strand:- start:12139 stop:15525 length:3387 start_codon:yes stop_codon:yes gene_type:complete